LQRIWIGGYNWDDELKNSLHNDCVSWIKQFSILNTIRIPRHVGLNPEAHIHVYVDASESAYGCVVYLKHDSSPMSLVASRSRVCPLKAVTMPRLELLSAVLGLEVGIKVAQAMEVDSNCIRFFSDSQIVLYWIKSSPLKYRQFVCHRLTLIQEKSQPSQWSYVSGRNNPADLVSRGTSLQKLKETELWWHGPEQKDNHVTSQKTEFTDELKKTVGMTIASHDEFRLSPVRFSSWRRYLHVVAWVRRFIHNTRSAAKKFGVLTAEEILEAEQIAIRTSQIECFPVEHQLCSKFQSVSHNSQLSKLNPKIDENGLLRMDSRLSASDLQFSAKYPIILPLNTQLPH